MLVRWKVETLMLSIIVSWCDRVELAVSLPSMLRCAELTEGDVTIVNFAGDRQMLAQQLGAHAGRVRVLEIRGEEFFSRSRAQNVGARHTDKPVMFFCDCDIVLDPEGIERTARRLLAEAGTFATLAGVRESERNSRGGRHVVSFGYQLEIRTADGRRLSIIDNEEDAETGARYAPGLLLVRREDFLGVGGYNGGLVGWGWEDQDMISRLTLGRGLRRISEGYAVHLSHDDEARIARYPKVKDRWESRDRMFRTALANYDRADFCGTYAVDTERFRPLQTT
jgi:hypothetical protein